MFGLAFTIYVYRYFYIKLENVRKFHIVAVKNLSVSQSFSLSKNKKVEYYIKMKAHHRLNILS